LAPSVILLALPFGAAFVVSMLFAPGMIAALRRRGVGQTISHDGPESHLPKAGTPTMGGLIILAGILGGALAISYLFGKPEYAWLTNRHDAMLLDLFAVLLLTLGFAVLGIVDDYLTINPIRNVRGIASKPKAAVQILLAIAFVMWLAYHRPQGFTPTLEIGGVTVFGGMLYWVFSVVFIVGMANFVNITDGLDGLVSGLTAIAAAAFVLTIVLIPPHRGIESATLLALLAAVAGACVAFLWFNANPAKVFMGDTGALAIGVALPAIAVVLHREVLMIAIGLVFVLDGLSTVIQWAVFKYTRVTTGTGRRVFRKSPVHHHFELCGWPEQTVVARFWICGVIAALIGFAGAGLGWW
jgi:phospho-N-acetylmuramoyl-pentapeptide-transferase